MFKENADETAGPTLNPEDFDKCWAISRIRTKFSHEEVNRLRLAWTYLLPRDEMRGVVVEDVTAGNCPRVVHSKRAVSDEWMLKLREDCRPLGLTRALLEAGTSVSGILNSTEIGLYNAQGGLNLVCPHRGELFSDCGGLTAMPEVFGVLVKCLVNAFQDGHRGFHLREMFNEAHGSTEKDWCLAGGNCCVRDDYSEYYSRPLNCFRRSKIILI